MPPAKKYPCLICSVEVGGKAGGVQCSYCDRWVHPKCANISKAHFELYKQPTCQYICETCVKISTKIKKEIQHLQVKQMEMREDIEANKEEIATQKRRMDKVERKVEELDPAKIIEQSRDSMLKELRERESRKDNLVIHQVEETEVGSGLEKKEQDIKKIKEIFDFLNCPPLNNDGIKFIFRVGEKKEERPGPRPIILCLKDPGARTHVLENARRLASTRFERISITPDLTPLQRKEEDGLRKEAESRNSAMTNDERLNYEWVLVGRKGQKSLIKRKRYIQGGEASRWRREGEGQARERNQRRNVGPARDIQPTVGTARQLAREEGERERVREAVREKNKEKEKNKKQKETNSTQPPPAEKEQELNTLMEPTAQELQETTQDEPSGIMDMEEEEEDTDGDDQSEQEEEAVQDTGTVEKNGREQRKRGQKEASLSPPTQTHKKKT